MERFEVIALVVCLALGTACVGCKSAGTEQVEENASNEAKSPSQSSVVVNETTPEKEVHKPQEELSGTGQAAVFDREKALQKIASFEAIASKEPSRSVGLESFSAEGASVSFFDHEGKVRAIELEGRGETYDVRLVFYYDEAGQPQYARVYKAFDPSKFMEEDDEDFVDASAAKYDFDERFYFVDGEIAFIESSGEFKKTSARVYDERSNLIMYDAPSYKPLPDAEYPQLFSRKEITFYARELFALSGHPRLLACDWECDPHGSAGECERMYCPEVEF